MIKNIAEVQAYINATIKEASSTEGKTDTCLSFDAGTVVGMRTMTVLLGYSGKFYWNIHEQTKEGNA